MNWWLLLYGFLFALGCFLGYIAYTEFQKTQNLLSDGITTTAVVKEFMVSSGDNNELYQPVLEYTDRRQEIRTYTSSIKSYPAPYKIGEKVKIIYDGKEMDKVKTLSFWGLYRGSVILFMIASPLLVIGGAYLLYQLY